MYGLNEDQMLGLAVILVAFCIAIVVVADIKKKRLEEKARKERELYKRLEAAVLYELNFPGWHVVSYFDDHVVVKSWQALEKYDEIKFFKENGSKLARAESIIARKEDITVKLMKFLANNTYKNCFGYNQLTREIETVLQTAKAYRVCVTYRTAAGNNRGSKEIEVRQSNINRYKDDPSLLMGKSEYSKILKEQEKEAISKKQQSFYAHVNSIINYANAYRDSLVVKGGQEKLDALLSQLFDRTVNSIKKIKTLNSEEWDMIGNLIAQTQRDMDVIVNTNRQILEYYSSPAFSKIKETCEVLMSTQREFNEYIAEKVQSISQLFGTKPVRNETVSENEYNYIRPYKKTITPFTAEVTAQVFASAENNAMEYVVKNFYPNKVAYPEQISKLYLLVEELETLRDAKQIIENHKLAYQQYLTTVPYFIMENDAAGFYSRLGFANIDESVLTVEYKFVYTSGAGLAQRSFTIPMTEETIAELIRVLESKLTASAFAKEQRNLMTKKLRDSIKARDNFTCCSCGNSTHKEPNLLLEIDHIIPVSKGGCTTETNLQTLCWKCNRQKGAKTTQ